MGIAVVIPTLNEAASLSATIASLKEQSHPADRIIVVDGGSTDATTTLAKEPGAEVLIARGVGRGGQIAKGVESCNEEVILIAHADMQFPASALAAIQSLMTERPDCPGGCLGHNFQSDRRIFRFIEWLDRRRARRGKSYGDQGQFVRRGALTAMGGFPALPIMEDLELSRRLRRVGVPAYLDVPVAVSIRRYQKKGWLRVAIQNWRLRLAFRRGGERACWRIYRHYYGGSQSLLRDSFNSAD